MLTLLFSAKSWRTSQCLCSYLAQWFTPFILAAIKGELFGCQTVNRVQETNCLHSDWLLKTWLWCLCFQLIYPSQLWEQLTAQESFETESNRFCDFWVSNLVFWCFFFFPPHSFFPSVSLREHRYHCSAHHKGSSSGHRYLPDCCVCALVCMLQSDLPISHQIVH